MYLFIAFNIYLSRKEMNGYLNNNNNNNNNNKNNNTKNI